MNQALDPLNLLILAVAVVVLWRLKSVLGTRTGYERRHDPYSAAEPSDKKPTLPTGDDKVIPMPGRKLPEHGRSAPAEEERAPVWRGVAEEGSSLAGELEKISQADREFSVQAFIEGAKIAYEMIVTAFAEGDRKALKPLLSREVFEGFDEAIATREEAGEALETKLVGIEKAELVAASLQGSRATATVRFLSQMISATRNRGGEVIDGDPQRIRDVTDVWTFERDLSSRDPNWWLIATEETA
jgi:predicted lipid-binding transport protein (Tim44 family)